MNKIKGPAAFLSALPAFIGRRGHSLGTLQRGRLLPLPHLHPAGRRAAFSTLRKTPSWFPSSSASMTTTSKTLLPMAASMAAQGPVTTTMSRSTPETARGRHVFEIAGYSSFKGLGVGKFIQSGTFSVGGYDWCVQYFPAGSADYSDDVSYNKAADAGDEEEEDGDDGQRYVSVFVALLSKDAPQVRANCSLRLVDPATGLVTSACPSMKRTRVFNGAGSTWGFGKFKNWSELEASGYVRDDCLKIQCDVSIVTGTSVSETEPLSDVPSESDDSDMACKV